MENQETTNQTPENIQQEENISASIPTETNTYPVEENEITTVQEVNEEAKQENLLEEHHEAIEEHHDNIHDQTNGVEVLFEELKKEEAAQEEAHEVNFELLSKNELIAHLDEAIRAEDVNETKTKIAMIRAAFMKKIREEKQQRLEKFLADGGQKENFTEELTVEENRFNEVFSIYKQRKAKFNEEQEKIRLDNLKRKQHILEELKLLINSEETLKKTYDDFKILQDQWKEIGMVPRNEINNLWQNYHFLVEKFFDKVKLNKELKDLDLKKNHEAKMSLCEKTEELLLESSIIKSFKQLQKYHEDWKEIGPVPNDKKDDIWERFRTATDKINERRREYYTRISDEQQHNLDTKSALCEQAEQVLENQSESIKTWQDNTHKINELLKVWKSIGPVPQKSNKEIWSRFKNGIDTFFATKKEYFDKLKEQQINNYNLKVNLCVQAERLKLSTDWKKTTSDLINLQKEWKEIGPVPRKYSDKIWKRFRSVCDEFFNAKSEFFKNIQGQESENLTKKLELIQRIQNYEFSDDKTECLEVLKGFQREWTEIGHIPMKEKDKVQNDFRAAVNKHLDRLKISEFEIRNINFMSKIENLKNDPNADRIIYKEKETLSSRIKKLQEDIHLWENNIGFLANSKNSILLKVEFEKKIERSKDELKLMEAKLKMLRTSASK